MVNLVITLLIVVGSALLSLFDKLKSKTEANYKKNNKMALGMFIFSLIGAGSVLFTGLDNIEKTNESNLKAELKEKEYNEANNKLIKSQEAIIHLQEALYDTTKRVLNNTVDLVNKSDSQKGKIEILNKNLINANELINQKNEVIISKSDELNKVITGYNSIPIVKASISYKDHKSGSHTNRSESEYLNKWILELSLENSGKYPIYNIIVQRKVSRYKVIQVDDRTTIDFVRNSDKIPVYVPYVIEEPKSSTYPYVCQITIKWKLEYSYIAVIKDDYRGYKIEDYYIFEGTKYKNSDSLIIKLQNLLVVN